MSHKKRYPCDIFDHVFPCNFRVDKARAIKHGTILENQELYIVKWFLTTQLLYILHKSFD